MKVVYQTCCGVDVHKSFLVATIIKTTSGVEPSYQKKRFSTFNNSILQFKEWLVKNQCRDVCMLTSQKLSYSIGFLYYQVRSSLIKSTFSAHFSCKCAGFPVFCYTN